jgi:hypothetical protein
MRFSSLLRSLWHHVLLAALCLALSPVVATAAATNIPPDKILIFSPRTRDLAEFEALARAAKEVGFTHVVISELSERTDLQGLDKDSPWCEWSTIMPSLFKHATPPGLEAAFPAAFVKRQMAFMKVKHDLAAGLGLRAAYYGVEPCWLNDAVYRAHPEWRGTRADNPLRSTGLFFAPNTDHPDVRAAYREAVRMITKECPNLDVFRFVANDSGSFYPWAARAFINPNGPTGYENRDMGERVVGFLQALRAGALDAGVQAQVYTECLFTADEMHSIRKSLQPGVGIAQMAPAPYTEDGSFYGFGGWGASFWMPSPLVNRMPTPEAVLSFANAVRTSPVRRLMTGGNGPEFFTALEAALEMPVPTCQRERIDVYTHMAASLYAADVADAVVDAWDSLGDADVMMGVAGVNVFSPTVLGRWLERPLVPYPERLTEEERSYWEPYFYESERAQPDTYLDYLTVFGYPEARSWEEATKTCVGIDRVEATLAMAAQQLDAAAARTASDDVRRRLRVDANRVRVQRCLTLNVRHTLQMGSLIRQRDRDNAAQPKTTKAEPISPNMPKGDDGSTGLFFMHRAMRWELDNTYELIRLLENSPEPLLFTEKDKANEGALFLGPDVLKNLRRKVEIMLKYWRTAEEGYYLPTKGG